MMNFEQDLEEVLAEAAGALTPLQRAGLMKLSRTKCQASSLSPPVSILQQRLRHPQRHRIMPAHGQRLLRPSLHLVRLLLSRPSFVQITSLKF